MGEGRTDIKVTVRVGSSVGRTIFRVVVRAGRTAINVTTTMDGVGRTANIGTIGKGRSTIKVLAILLIISIGHNMTLKLPVLVVAPVVFSGGSARCALPCSTRGHNMTLKLTVSVVAPAVYMRCSFPTMAMAGRLAARA